MAFSLIAHVAKQGTSGGTGDSSAIDTSGADTLLAVVVDFSDVGVSSFTDSKSNTWVEDENKTVGAAARVRILRCTGGTVGTGHTFKATGTGTFPAIAVAAFSGGHATPLDQHHNNFGVSSTATPGSVTPTQNGELIFGGIGDAWATTVTIDSGQTILDQLGIVGGTSFAVLSYYEIQTTATARNPACTLPASARWEACICTYKSTGISASIGLASETDTAFSMSASKSSSVGLATETDTAFGLSSSKSLGVGLASETDSAFPVTHSVSRSIGLATETDTAFPLATSSKTMGVGQAIEHDIALPMRAIQIGRHRWLVRSGHVDIYGQTTIDNLRMWVKRGVGSYDHEPKIRMRANKDNMGFGGWVSRGLGLAGERSTTLDFGSFGSAFTWQFEIEANEDVDIELMQLQALTTRLGH